MVKADIVPGYKRLYPVFCCVFKGLDEKVTRVQGTGGARGVVAIPYINLFTVIQIIITFQL